MASYSQSKRALLNHLSDKGSVGGKNPIGQIATAIHVPAETVRKMVRELGQDGKLAVQRDPAGRATSVSHVDPKGHRDRTEKSSWSKREAMFAKGVPSVLPDSLCTPVEVRFVEPRKATEAKEAPSAQTIVYEEGAPYHETLTNCLTALQMMADENGKGEDISVRSVLLLIENMTQSRATRAMAHLNGMKLYRTYASGFSTSSYVVSTEATVVTEDMVKQYREHLKRRRQADVEPAPIDDTVQAVDDQVELTLVEIIETLESRIAELTSVNQTLEGNLLDVNEQRDRLLEENNTLRSKIDELEKRPPREVAHDPRVAEIVARYTSPQR